MKRNWKGVVALLLCALLLAQLPLSAAALTVSITPVVYIADMADIDLYENPQSLNPELVFSRNSSDFRNVCLRMLTALLLSSDRGAASALPEITAGVNTIFAPIACSAKGLSKNPAVGVLKYDKSLAQYPGDAINTPVVNAITKALASEVDKNHFYVFLYDWRLAPTDNAVLLQAYIDRVKAECGAQKVSLIGAGYGGVIANAYLCNYREHAAESVHACAMLNSPLLGNALIGDLMKGKLVKKAGDNNSIVSNFETITGEERGKALLRYVNDDPSNFLYSLTQSLLGSDLGGQILGALAKQLLLEILRSEGSMDKLAKTYNNFVLLAGDAVYAQGLKDYLRTMPGLWALIPEEDFADAVAFLFGDEIVDYDFAQRLVATRNVVKKTAETLKLAQADGVRMYVVANYARQIIPGTVSIDDLSDGIESTKYASAGAITLDCDKTWPVQNNCMNASHSHRSPDNVIEANNCALPENTWFIKGLKHLDFQYATTAEFIAWMITSSTQRNVWETEDYPQFMTYSKSRKVIMPYSDNGGSSPGDLILGDTDLDGAVTPADARTVLRYSVQLETPTRIMRIVADVDGDGEIMPADARLVLRYSVGLISTFPAEGE